MSENIVRRMRNGVGAGMATLVSTISVQLIGVPLLLHAWGAHLYGEWLILFAFPGYLAMADLGFSQSAANDMIHRIARGDHAGARGVFQSLSALLFACIAACIAILALCSLFLPIEHYWHSSDITVQQVRLIILCFGIEMLAQLLDGLNMAGLRSGGDFVLHTSSFAITYFFQHAGIWTMALLRFGPVAAAATFLVVRGIGLLVTAGLMLRRHAWLRLGFSEARGSELARLFRPALANISMPLGSAINIQGMVFVVGAFLGPTSVVIFSTSRILTRLLLQFVMTIFNAAEPELAAAHGKSDSALTFRLFSKTLRLGLWLSVTIATGLFLFGGMVLRIWTGNGVRPDMALLAWLLISAILSGIWMCCLTVIRAENRHLHIAIVFCASAALAVGLAIATVSITGRLSSVGFALAVMDTIVTIYAIRTVCVRLNIGPTSLAWQMLNLRPLLAMARHRM